MRISDWSSDVCSSDLLGAGFHVVFGGNLGKAQALPAVIAAAERLQGDPDMRIWLFGSGALFGWLKSEIAQRNLTNVVLGGRMPPTAMPAIYAPADALLLSLLDDPLIAPTLPSKRSAERRGGQECVRTCRSMWWPSH